MQAVRHAAAPGTVHPSKAQPALLISPVSDKVLPVSGNKVSAPGQLPLYRYGVLRLRSKLDRGRPQLEGRRYNRKSRSLTGKTLRGQMHSRGVTEDPIP